MTVAIAASSPRAATLLGAMRRNLELLIELEKTDPAGVEMIVEALVTHLRSWKPLPATSVQLGTGPFTLVEGPPLNAVVAIERAICAEGKYRLSLDDGHLVMVLTDEMDEKPERAVGVLTPEQSQLLRDDIASVLKGVQ